LDRFRNILASFARRANAQSINSIHKITQTQEIVDQPITQASMAESIVSLARDRTEELEQVYDALNAVTEELEELKANSPKAELDKHKTEVRRLKTSDTDKIISQILLAVFDNLAFPPGTPRLIIEKFKTATMLWQTLAMLNSGVAVPMTRIRGRAGDLGWKEVMKHVSTGSDTRGRVYCRTSPNDHSFDVVLHWKKDSKEQQKFLNSLGKYSYFSDSKTVMV
jgi:hypothetical protein